MKYQNLRDRLEQGSMTENLRGATFAGPAPNVGWPNLNLKLPKPIISQ